MKKNSWTELKRGTLLGICFAVLLMFAAVPCQAQQTTVSLNMPELVKGNTVYATVSVDNVENLDAGQFDLVFNPDVLKIVSVENGSIGNTEIPVQWRSVDSKTARVIFNLEGVNGVSGSGELAKIGFEVISDGKGDLIISNGLLGNTEAKRIDTIWGDSKDDGKEGEEQEADTKQTATPGFETELSMIGLTAVVCLARGKQR
ncbi:cohesin domain-containing protein [Methanosarcina sp. Kolksee]|uniref:cohesin domain-containing protein n=1 Tax=Methanosarcina sp. Kolksee TaxID=1434099 RepID=UPI00064F6A77|nr:cohesin domain-containing protein [Methanosarcina sp. Kolksee]